MKTQTLLKVSVFLVTLLLAGLFSCTKGHHEPFGGEQPIFPKETALTINNKAQTATIQYIAPTPMVLPISMIAESLGDKHLNNYFPNTSTYNGEWYSMTVYNDRVEITTTENTTIHYDRILTVDLIIPHQYGGRFTITQAAAE